MRTSHKLYYNITKSRNYTILYIYVHHSKTWDSNTTLNLLTKIIFTCNLICSRYISDHCEKVTQTQTTKEDKLMQTRTCINNLSHDISSNSKHII